MPRLRGQERGEITRGKGHPQEVRAMGVWIYEGDQLLLEMPSKSDRFPPFFHFPSPHLYFPLAKPNQSQLHWESAGISPLSRAQTGGRRELM